MEKDLITLPIALGLEVNKMLKQKIQFTPRMNKAGLPSFEFTEEELALIDKLKFENPIQGTLKGIELLPNLRSLTVRSKGDEFIQDKMVASISDKDSACIAKCKNLEYLDIKNQVQMSYIDVTKMEHLHSFSVNNNDGLEEILGLDSLKELWGFDCFGNRILTQIKGLDSIIMQNQELTDLNLDLLLFPDAAGYDVKFGKLNEAMIKKLNEMTVTWHESFGKDKSIKIDNGQMMNMHKKAIAALEEYVPKHCSSRDAVIGIEQYFSENVKYDYKSIEGNISTHNSDGLRVRTTLWRKWCI